ncbi:MAG: protein kinase [Gemmatimonadales bacterium]
MASDELLAILRDGLSGRYILRGLIGQGGMSTVFLAEELHPTRKVAIKVLDPTLSDRVSRERFLREVEIASALTHPHIVPIFVTGEVAGLLYYVMPFISGLSLRARLIKGDPIAPPEAISIAQDIAEALGHAHNTGIVHRDVKPENVLFSGGHALVTDFGIARALYEACSDNLTIAGHPIGTPGYMSPEQASGARKVDGRSDLYSLGCVLHEMIYGKTPTSASDAGTADPLDTADGEHTVTEEVAAILAKATAWDPDERFPTIDDFSEALAHAHPRVALQIRREPDLQSRPDGVRNESKASLEPDEKSIAVLPFTNMSLDPENEYFSDGITDDIIAQLSRIGDLRLTSRTSVMPYKHTDKHLREIGNELGVAAILEGSVRRAENRVRIVAQLIDVRTDAHLWSETYDRDLTDIFEIQSDVAKQIARALEAKFTPTEQARVNRKPTDNVEAYNLYLKGMYYWNKFTPASSQKAMQCFEEAIELDPQFAWAHAGLANAYFIAGTGQGSPPSAEAFECAKEAAERALEIDGSLCDAHATLASVYTWREWDWEAGAAEFTCARANATRIQEPNIKYGYYLAVRGEHDEAIRRSRRAVELEPVSLNVNTNLAWQLYWARRFDESIEQLGKTFELDYNFAPAHVCLGWNCLVTGRVDEAIQAFETANGLAGPLPGRTAALACAYGDAGCRDEVDKILEELLRDRRSGDHYVSPRDIALVYAWSGRPDPALEWIERACSERAAWMSFIEVDPAWDRLRKQPRFREQVRCLGLHPDEALAPTHS